MNKSETKSKKKSSMHFSENEIFNYNDNTLLRKLRTYIYNRIFYCEWINNKKFISWEEVIAEVLSRLNNIETIRMDGFIKKTNSVIQIKWIEYIKHNDPIYYEWLNNYQKEWRKNNRDKINGYRKNNKNYLINNINSQKRFIEKNPKRYLEIQRKSNKKAIINISDSYVRGILKYEKKTDITNEMIEQRRAQIIERRNRKKKTPEVSSSFKEMMRRRKENRL